MYILPDSLIKYIEKLTPPKKDDLSRLCKPILLIGPARTGKSILSEKMKKKYGFCIVSLDKIQWILEKNEFDDNVSVRIRIIELILEKIPTGVILEGDSLVGKNFLSSKTSDNLSLIQYFNLLMLNKKGLLVTIITSNVDPSSKASSIKTYRESNVCWTSKNNYDEDQVFNLSKRMIDYGEKLKKVSEVHGIKTLEIDNSNFNESIEGNIDLLIKLTKNKN